jgi:hypothetical protein
MERELKPKPDTSVDRKDKNFLNQYIVRFVLNETFVQKYDTSQKQLQRTITGTAATEGAVLKK